MSERTICGGCNCRVSVKLQHPDDHNCVLMADLKKDFNLALSEVQNDYERRIKNLDKKLQETDRIGNCQSDMINILCVKLNKLKEELSTCIDVKLLYSDRQARDSWQQGCEVMIADLCKRVADMDYMLKQSLGCVDNSHADENANRFGLPTLDKLANAVRQELKVHHPSRKHLEGKLREKNERIKQLEETLVTQNADLTNALNDVQKRRDKIHFLDKSWNQSQHKIENLQSRVGHLAEALGCLQRENETLRHELTLVKGCRK